MKTKAISSLFVLIAIVAGVAAANPAFADHTTATVSVPAGSSVPGCEETNACYIPSEVTVDVGGEVTWSNDDSAAHTVTGGSAVDGPSGVFDSSLFMAGATFSHKFEEAGTFNYFCMVHPWMEGKVVVQEAMADDHDDDKPVMDESVSAMGMLSDETMVSVSASEVTEGEKMEITVEFAESEHANYDIKVTQNDEVVLEEMGVHSHEAKMTHETAALASSDPVDITVTFQGFGVEDPKTGPIGEEVVFSNIVPEFGTVAMMILVVSIISIVAVTAKSRVIPKL